MLDANGERTVKANVNVGYVEFREHLHTCHEGYDSHIEHLSPSRPIPRILLILFGEVNDLHIISKRLVALRKL